MFSYAKNTAFYGSLLPRTTSTAAVLCLLLGALLAPVAAAEEIKIGGTGNALGTARLLGDAFSAKSPGFKVLVLNSLGTSGAIKAVPKGAIDIGLSSRALTTDELALGLVAVQYASSPTVFAISAKFKPTDITLQQVADIYSGKLASWPGGAPARPVLRQPGDDNTKQIKALSAAIEAALNTAEQRPGLAYAMTDQEAADKIESIPGAFGITTQALILSEGRALRALSLNGVEPTTKNAASGVYPMAKHFFFITKPLPSPAVQQFIAFVKSPAGSEILEKTGHWTN